MQTTVDKLNPKTENGIGISRTVTLGGGTVAPQIPYVVLYFWRYEK